MAKSNSRFQAGSGVYVCRTCKHNTRDTGGDGAGVQLCDLCYELAGEENSISDNGGETYNSAENVRAELAALDKRNGAGTARRVFPTVCDAVNYELPLVSRSYLSGPALQKNCPNCLNIMLADVCENDQCKPVENNASIFTQQEISIARRNMRLGGSFASQLADLIAIADSGNYKILEKAFEHLIRRFI